MAYKIVPTSTKILQKKPLILCLTNNVTMDFVANCLLSIGAAPIISNERHEFEELVKLSSAICINIGTLDANFITNAKILAKIAQNYNKPIVLDPAGAGASTIRTKTAKDLLPLVNVIRGNASEIIALSGRVKKTLGVESTHAVKDAKDSAIMLANKYKCVVTVSGSEDLITDDQKQEILPYGSPIMSKITGMGCALTATIAAFISVNKDIFAATVSATSYFGLCGNKAEQITSMPGTFRSAFIDALWNHHAI